LDSEKNLIRNRTRGASGAPAKIFSSGKSLRRYFHIEREFHVVTGMMAACADAVQRSQLSGHRDAIIIEARQILRTLDILKPSWCLAK
jgi:hypothetical protein